MFLLFLLLFCVALVVDLVVVVVMVIVVVFVFVFVVVGFELVVIGLAVIGHHDDDYSVARCCCG